MLGSLDRFGSRLIRSRETTIPAPVIESQTRPPLPAPDVAVLLRPGADMSANYPSGLNLGAPVVGLPAHLNAILAPGSNQVEVSVIMGVRGAACYRVAPLLSPLRLPAYAGPRRSCGSVQAWQTEP